MKELPKLVFDGKYLRVKLPTGELLPETELKIDNNVDHQNRYLVTVSFFCDLDLKEK